MISSIKSLDLHNDLTDTITLTIKLLRLLGMWMFADGTFHYSHMAISLSQMFVSIQITLTDVYMALPDVVEATKNACFFFAAMLPTLKMLNFMVKRYKMMEMHNTIINIFWNNPGKHPDNPMIMLRDARRGSLLATLNTIMVFNTGFLDLSLPLVYMLQEFRAGEPVKRRLPFAIYPPFGLDSYKTPLYELTYGVEILAVTFTLLCISSFDNIYVVYVMNTAAQFRVLQNDVKLIGLNDDGEIETAEFDERTEIHCYQELCECIKKHYLLLQFSEDMESVFTMTLLVQFSVSSLFLCLCGFQIVTLEGDIIALLLFVSYFITALLQLFMYCWTSNEIVTTSSGVADAVYECAWTRARRRGWRDSVCLFVQRAQRPAALTAGGFYPVTLETFTTILSTAGSYFTLLTTMAED